MIINDDLLTKIEKLSSLKISDDKRAEISQQLSKIVSFVENLNELDLKNMKHEILNDSKNALILREDEAKSDLDIIKIIFENNKNNDNNCFVVPKIIE